MRSRTPADRGPAEQTYPIVCNGRRALIGCSDPRMLKSVDGRRTKRGNN